MDTAHFDAWTRRRFGFMTAGALAAAFGLARAEPARARKRKKKLKLNEFGCVAIGGRCLGKDGNCCSGRCKGEKPKKGEKDKSRCVAHDASTCRAGQASVDCGGVSNVLCTTSVNDPGFCETTTGGAPYCKGDGRCRIACTKDVECERICGAGAACVPCSNCALVGLALCVGLGTTSCTLQDE